MQFIISYCGCGGSADINPCCNCHFLNLVCPQYICLMMAWRHSAWAPSFFLTSQPDSIWRSFQKFSRPYLHVFLVLKATFNRLVTSFCIFKVRIMACAVWSTNRKFLLLDKMASSKQTHLFTEYNVLIYKNDLWNFF